MEVELTLEDPHSLEEAPSTTVRISQEYIQIIH